MNNIQQLINKAQNIVVFSGAGFSTQSGIPDFRSTEGLYSNKKYDHTCEEMLSKSFFEQNTEEFYKFYKAEMLHLNALPNVAHHALVVLEKAGKLKAIITQNIDGLHQIAGNKKVIELHGSVYRNYCTECNARFSVENIVEANDIPYCPICGGVIKPDVVLYEESLDALNIQKAINALQKSDLLIVAGTSLQVYPAAGFLSYFRGENIIVINKQPTNVDKNATIVSHNNISDELSFLLKRTI